MKKDANLLIEEAKSGAESAFARLYKMYYVAIKCTIYNIVKNRDVTEDLISVTFAKAFRKLDSYTNPISFEMWLKTIAVNSAIDYIRKMKNEKLNNYADDENPCNTFEFEESAPSPESEMIIKEDYKNMLECIKYLRSNYRAILTARYIDNLSYKDIAKKLSIKEDAVKSELYKARQRLIKNFNLIQ